MLGRGFLTNVGTRKFGWNLTLPSGVGSNKINGNLDSLKTDSLIVTLENSVSNGYQFSLNVMGGNTLKSTSSVRKPSADNRAIGITQIHDFVEQNRTPLPIPTSKIIT